MIRNDIVALIIETVEDLRREREAPWDDPVTESTALFGQGGLFDSLGLVSLIVDIEQRLGEPGPSVALDDERAMSQKRSPYRTVGSLADFICELVEEQHNVS